MKVRKQYYGFSGLLLIVSILFLFLAIYVTSHLGPCLLFPVMIYGIYIQRLKCKQCRKPILLYKNDFPGLPVKSWSFAIPAQCSHCGEPFQ